MVELMRLGARWSDAGKVAGICASACARLLSLIALVVI